MLKLRCFPKSRCIGFIAEIFTEFFTKLFTQRYLQAVLFSILCFAFTYFRPLHLACISGYVDVVAALIRMAPHPCLFNIQNDEAQTPLHLATLTAQPKIIRMLLIAGAEVSKS